MKYEVHWLPIISHKGSASTSSRVGKVDHAQVPQDLKLRAICLDKRVSGNPELNIQIGKAISIAPAKRAGVENAQDPLLGSNCGFKLLEGNGKNLRKALRKRGGGIVHCIAPSLPHCVRQVANGLFLVFFLSPGRVEQGLLF